MAAHVTLVFPFDSIAAEAAAAHMFEVATRWSTIALRLAAVIPVADAVSHQSHLFLVPDQGRAEIEALHDDLYAGPLAGALRTDIAFIPHVTVGVFDHHDEAEDTAREIGRIGMAGRLPALELVSFDGAAVRVLERFSLAE